MCLVAAKWQFPGLDKIWWLNDPVLQSWCRGQNGPEMSLALVPIVWISKLVKHIIFLPLLVIYFRFFRFKKKIYILKQITLIFIYKPLLFNFQLTFQISWCSISNYPSNHKFKVCFGNFLPFDFEGCVKSFNSNISRRKYLVQPFGDISIYLIPQVLLLNQNVLNMYSKLNWGSC